MGFSLKTPNGYLAASPSDGAGDAAVAIPAGTRIIEVTALTKNMIAGLSNSADVILDSSPSTKAAAVAMAGGPAVEFRVSPDADFGRSAGTTPDISGTRARRFTHVHYKPAESGVGQIVINFFK